MSEPSWKTPQAPEEDSWAVVCPMGYCGANPGESCMSKYGGFTNTHNVRRRAFSRPNDKERGPGTWSRRPPSETKAREDFEEHPDWDEFFEDVQDFLITDENTEKRLNREKKLPEM